MKKVWAGAAVISLATSGLFVAPRLAGAQSRGQAPLGSAEASRLAENANQKVIVVLKDQVPQAPASRAAVASRRSVENREQQPLLSELSQVRATNVKTYTFVNAVAATVSKGEAARLAANPAVAEVVPDQIIRLAPFSAKDLQSAAVQAGAVPVPGACPAPGEPALLPQALPAIHAASNDPSVPTARSLGFDGAGVTVAYIAEGIDINNPEFIRKDGSHVFVDYKDFTGEGTAVPTPAGEAFLDASSIAAQGNKVYDVSHYSKLALDRPCRVRVEGVAPGASLVGLDTFGSGDTGFNSSFLQAIDYAVSVDHVNVLNESFGSNPFPDSSSSNLIKQADDAAVAAGTVVTVSSGDAGVTNTQGSPATDPNLISAGASTTYQGPVEVGENGSNFGVTGWLDNNISSLSSAGFDQNGRTVDEVAPGELSWVACTPNLSLYSDCRNDAGQATPVVLSGGTSMSAPLTAGVSALVDQAYAKTHGGAFPTPAVVKDIIVSTTDDIKAPADQQGTGLLDAYRAVVAAEDWPGGSGTTASANAAVAGATPSPVVESATQLNVVGAEGSYEAFTDTLTNLGSQPVRVDLSARALGSYTPVVDTTVTLSDAKSPKSSDYRGRADNYETVHFTVPAGTDRLNASMAYQAAPGTSPTRITLVDPSGRLAGYSLPQGNGNYGNTQVAEPSPGRWTAYIWAPTSAYGGNQGRVVFGASVAKFGYFGNVSPSTLTLAPGKSAPVTLRTYLPGRPGDTSGSLVISVAGQPTQTVPVTLRSLVPSGYTGFDGILTGGNGRQFNTGVTEYYQVDIPAGRPELNASITLADNPNNQLYAWLVDPSGQAQAYQTNGIVTADSRGQISYTNTLGTNLHVLAPQAGRWTLILDFAPTVSGTALTEGYRVTLNQHKADVTQTGAPHGRTITADHPAVVRIHVHNNGTAPEAYFVDGRLNSLSQYQLPSQTGSNSTTVPLTFSENVPSFVVPSQTYAATATATTTGTEPIQFDFGPNSGDPDVASNVGTSVQATLTGNPLTAGPWFVAPTVAGAFGPQGAAQEPVNTTFTVQSQTFDPGVTSAPGDLWQSSLGAPATVSPVVVQPGQSANIPVIITPSAASGTQVSGVLYLDDDSLVALGGVLEPNANTVAAIPYSYMAG